MSLPCVEEARPWAAGVRRAFPWPGSPSSAILSRVASVTKPPSVLGGLSRGAPATPATCQPGIRRGGAANGPCQLSRSQGCASTSTLCPHTARWPYRACRKARPWGLWLGPPPTLKPESVTKEEGGIDLRWENSLLCHSPDRSLPKSADPMQADGWTCPEAERGGRGVQRASLCWWPVNAHKSHTPDPHGTGPASSCVKVEEWPDKPWPT